MPINLTENEILLRCACHAADHMAFLTYEPDDSRGNNLKGENDDWYLTVVLDPYPPIWRRIWMAMKYIFSPHSMRYGMYSEIVLRNEDVDKIQDFIGERRIAAKLEAAGFELN